MSKSSRLLAALITGLSAGFFMPAFSEEVSYCSNVGHYCRSSVNSDCCGADLSSPTAGANLASDGVDGSVTSNRAAGTIDGCIYAGSTEPTKAQIEAGSAPCLNTKAVASPSAGVNSFTSSNRFDSLSSSTEYRAAYVQDDGTNRPLFEIVTTAPFTTLASAGGGGTDLTGTGIFVGCGAGASDSNTGTSHAQRWASASKVNNSITADGTNVYFQEGCVFEDQQLTVDWEGTTSDPVLISAYRMDGSTPRECTRNDSSNPEDTGSSTDCTLPEINGTLEASCRADQTCPVDHADAVPNGFYIGLVHLALNMDHVHVKNLALHDSSGRCLSMAGSQFRTGIVVDNINCDYAASTGIELLRERYSLVSNNYVARTNWCSKAIGDTPGYAAGSSRNQCPTQTWGSAIRTGRGTDATPNYTLVINNYVHSGGGEGISFSDSKKTAILFNFVGNMHSSGIYGDRGESSFIFGNMVWGNRTDPFRLSGSPGFDGIGAALEESGFNNWGDHLWVNNVVFGTGNGIALSSITVDGVADGGVQEMDVYFNTVWGTSTALFANSSNTTGNGDIRAKNNILGGDNAGQIRGSALRDIDYNCLSGTVDDDMTTTNSVTSCDPDIVTVAEARAFSHLNLPTWADAALGASSQADEIGVLLSNETRLDASNWGGSDFTDMMQACRWTGCDWPATWPGADIDARDIEYTVRNNPPDAGPVED